MGFNSNTGQNRWVAGSKVGAHFVLGASDRIDQRHSYSLFPKNSHQITVNYRGE